MLMDTCICVCVYSHVCSYMHTYDSLSVFMYYFRKILSSFYLCSRDVLLFVLCAYIGRRSREPPHFILLLVLHAHAVVPVEVRDNFGICAHFPLPCGPHVVSCLQVSHLGGPYFFSKLFFIFVDRFSYWILRFASGLSRMLCC